MIEVAALLRKGCVSPGLITLQHFPGNSLELQPEEIDGVGFGCSGLEL